MKFNIRLLYFVLFIGLSMSEGLTQSPIQPISSTIILSDFRNNGKQNLPNFTTLFERNLNQSRVSKLEFRTETHEYNWKEQELSFRMSFNSRDERESSQQELQNNIELIKLKSELTAQSQMMDAYEMLVEFYFADQLKTLLGRKAKILEDKKVVLQRIIHHSGEFKVSDLLKLEDQIYENSLNQNNVNTKLKSLSKIMSQGLNTSSDILKIDTFGWISIETIDQTRLSFGGIKENNTHYAIQQNKISATEIKLSQDNAKNSKVWDYVQVKYGGRERTQVRNRISLGIGLQIPLKSINRNRINSSLIDIQEEQLELSQIDSKYKATLKANNLKFDRLKEKLNYLQEISKQDKLGKSYNNLVNRGSVDPIVLLSLKELLISRKIDILFVKRSLYNIYLKIIDLHGLINSENNTNYLSETLNQY